MLRHWRIEGGRVGWEEKRCIEEPRVRKRARRARRKVGGEGNGAPEGEEKNEGTVCNLAGGGERNAWGGKGVCTRAKQRKGLLRPRLWDDPEGDLESNL